MLVKTGLEGTCHVGAPFPSKEEKSIVLPAPLICGKFYGVVKLRRMTKIQDLQKLILKFRNERDWEQFHKPKDCAAALVSEAVEVLDHFKWKNEKEIKEYLAKNKKEVADELCDVLFWVLLMTYDLKIDLPTAFQRKMKINAQKYPVQKSKGSHKKYTEL